MSRNTSEAKQRIEAKYDLDEQTADTGDDHAGLMTIAFCGFSTSGVGGCGDYGGVIK